MGLIIVAATLAAVVAAGTLSYTAIANFPVAKNGPEEMPVLKDTELRAEVLVSGLEFPTSIAFLDADTILVTQKNDGKVRLISGGELKDEPVLQLDVEEGAEQGLLGIAVAAGETGDQVSRQVFLYLTEKDRNGGDGGNTTGNRVYSYDFDHEKSALVNETLILDLPGEPGPFHNGGKIKIGPSDGHLYAIIGDVNEGGGILDNTKDGRQPDDRSVILRVDKNTGLPVEGNPFLGNGDDQGWQLARYYAYGIRNGFGMDFDPVTGHLWMTENGPDSYDEINLVTPGFNSGWHVLVGPISRSNVTLDDLVLLDGASYQDPVISWRYPIGITDLEFYDSGMLGSRYENGLFVGDINYGNLYFFELDPDRTGLSFSPGQQAVADRVIDPDDAGSDINSELESIRFGKGFNRITEIETGPDGYLYVVTYLDGKIYKIAR